MAYANVEDGTYVGNIGRVYDLRRVGQDNKAVIDFTVAATPRYYETGEWVEGEVMWISCTAWNRLAEEISENLSAGIRVMVIGHKSTKKGYTKEDGTEVPEREILVVDFIGPEMTFGGVSVKKREKNVGGASPRPKTSASSSSAAPLKKEAKKSAPKSDDFDIDDFDIDDEFDDDEQPF